MKPEEIELLRELTIVMPTCEKPENLERAIEYWRDTPITVHIVDGSKNPWFRVGVLPDISTITYHHLPSTANEVPLENYSRRLQFSITLPTTKYSALCADDDVFTISGLCALIRILENDLNCDAIVGQTLGFYPQNKLVRWWLRYGVVSSDNLSSRNQDAIVRLRRSPLMLYYAIVRTDLWIKRIQITQKHVSLGMRWEALFQEVSKAMFRARSINQIVWLRFKTVRHLDQNPNIQSNESTYTYMREWAIDKKNFHEVALYVDILVESILLVNPGSDQQSIKEAVHEFVMKHPELRGRFPRFTARRKALLVRLFSKFDKNTVNYLPEYLREIVSRNFIPAEVRAAIGSKKVLDEFLPNFLKTGIAFDLDELKNLEKLWLKPREELRLRANI
jgi:glycosyltransferase domain-containing protein